MWAMRAFAQVREGAVAMGSWRDDIPGVTRLLNPQGPHIHV